MYFTVVFTMKYNTYSGDSIQQHKIKQNKKLRSTTLTYWTTASMLINKVSDDASQ